ncbi:hypothetical protein ETSB_0883 [cyanobacterium endosymbiont of Epithemia turgida isolate EtSB Lake Yunoko]|nr:hypothetical protein ETSB_0883 [cyanobacterium endosymbiont of Epithemia turgida isolate EtSB Lake Yunoko]
MFIPNFLLKNYSFHYKLNFITAYLKSLLGLLQMVGREVVYKVLVPVVFIVFSHAKLIVGKKLTP